MTIVATITRDTGSTFSFDKFLTADGRVPDWPVTVEEELTAAGVDGRRFREVSQRLPTFVVQTLETTTTYATAVSKCRQYDGIVGGIVRLVITNLGGTAVYTYERVHVRAATPRAMPGVVAGSASGSSHAAYIEATLTLVLMESTLGSNP